ncbi:MAG: hypothetical protein QOJ19_3348 [Acidimicrobiia bacterium]|jgi:hypothetical protein|nr:hypothetical protein [Acidimicrobiia bacterium]
MGSRPVKKGRHRRFEEARALKRSTDFDPDRLFESLQQGSESNGAHEDDGDDIADYDDEDDDADDQH